VQLDDIEPSNLSGLANDVSVVGPEHANALHAGASRVEYAATDPWIDPARAVGEYHSDVVGTDLGGERSVLRAKHAAELNLCEHCRSS
jgi:hypothetical protein